MLKCESESVIQSYPTLRDPVDCGPQPLLLYTLSLYSVKRWLYLKKAWGGGVDKIPWIGSSVHGILQARILE